ncbi:hypothetical protein IFR05_004845 [Cadophora sp. M221]|nr:hypothetical protein IFR05_004845 [Cadophora sp. M221]
MHDNVPSPPSSIGSYGSYATLLPTLGASRPFARFNHYVVATDPQDAKLAIGETSDSKALPAMNIHKNISTINPRATKEQLDPNFKVYGSKCFKPGQVFKVLWAEPKGKTSSAGTTVTRHDLETKYRGENAYTSVRRFIIVAADVGHCQCLPILTYGGKATLRLGVKPEVHAIVYMDGQLPQPLPGEALSLEPIKVNPKTNRDKLDPASRVNYAKIYTVEHNVKVQFIGKISDTSRRTFMNDFDLVWDQKRKMPG